MTKILASILNFLSSFSLLEGQPTPGALRFICSPIFFFVLARHDAVTESGRLDFSCDSNITVVDKELCFLHYSAEINPLMQLYHFLLVTAFILLVLWAAMIRYSSIHLKKIRGAKFSSEREYLCEHYLNMFLLHVRSEAAFISVILVSFSCTQKICSADTYNCNLNAQVVMCVEVHHREKRVFNIFFIGWMLFTLFLCILTIVWAQCYKENFIKELLFILDTTGKGAENKGDTDSSRQCTSSLTEKKPSQFVSAGAPVSPSSSDTNRNQRQRGSGKQRKSGGGRKP